MRKEKLTKNLAKNLFLKISCLVFSIIFFTFTELKTCADSACDTRDAHDTYDHEELSEIRRLELENQSLKQQLQLYERATGLHAARASELWRVTSELATIAARSKILEVQIDKLEVARRSPSVSPRSRFTPDASEAVFRIGQMSPVSQD